MRRRQLTPVLQLMTGLAGLVIACVLALLILILLSRKARGADQAPQ
jgi:hypothetical protein